MTGSNTADIAIAGGSTTGLALALALARSVGPDLGIVVIDRGTGGAGAGAAASQSRDGPAGADPRAVAVSASSRRMLAALGVWRAIESDAEPIRRIEITDSGLDAGVRPVLLGWDNAIADAEGGAVAAGHIVPLPILNAALEQAVAREASIRILRSTDVVDLTTDAFGAELTCRGVVGGAAGSQAVSARLVVAADGQRSAVRAAAGIKIVAWPYDQIGIATTIAHEREHGGVAVQHFLPAGPFAILPLTGRRSCVTWTEEASVGQHIMALGDDEFLAEVDLRFGGKLGALSLAGGRRAWPLRMQLARSYVGQRLALVGDAAHAVHPLAGQGLNLAFRDVAALVEVIADAVRAGLDPGDGIALARYERWRRFDAMAAAASFDALNRLFSRDNRLLRSARELGLQVVDRMPGLKRALIGEASGVAGEMPRLLQGRLA